jgi:hypothetical protein
MQNFYGVIIYYVHINCLHMFHEMWLSTMYFDAVSSLSGDFNSDVVLKFCIHCQGGR